MSKPRFPRVDWPVMSLGLGMLVFGVVSWWEGQSITRSLRKPGVYDVVGPDHYLEGVAWVLIVIGLLLMGSTLRGLTSYRAEAVTDEEDPFWGEHLWLLVTLVAYTSAIPWLGYLGATVLFLAVSFRVLGMTGWLRILLLSIASSVAFVAIFVWFTGMSLNVLPRGF